MQKTLKAMRNKVDTLMQEYQNTANKLNINSHRGAVNAHLKGQAFAYSEAAKELQSILDEVKISRKRRRKAKKV